MGKIEGAELAGYCGLYCDACGMKNGQIRDTASTLQRILEASEISKVRREAR